MLLIRLQHIIRSLFLLFLSCAVLNSSMDAISFRPINNTHITASFNKYNSVLEYITETVYDNPGLFKDPVKGHSSQTHKAKVQVNIWALPVQQITCKAVKPAFVQLFARTGAEDYDKVDRRITIPPPKTV